MWFFNLISWHLQGIVFARQNLQSTSHPFDIGNGRWNLLVISARHLFLLMSNYVLSWLKTLNVSQKRFCFFYSYVCSRSWQSLHVPILYLQNTCFCNSHSDWLPLTDLHFLLPIRNRHLPGDHENLVNAEKGGEEDRNPWAWLAKMKWYACTNVHYVIKFVHHLWHVSGFIWTLVSSVMIYQ